MHGTQPNARAQAFLALLRERLVILDGGMGTMIQGHALDEAQFRGERFAAWRSDLRGNNDLLTLTQPKIIGAIHRQYLLRRRGCHFHQYLQFQPRLAGGLRNGSIGR